MSIWPIKDIRELKSGQQRRSIDDNWYFTALPFTGYCCQTQSSWRLVSSTHLKYEVIYLLALKICRLVGLNWWMGQTPANIRWLTPDSLFSITVRMQQNPTIATFITIITMCHTLLFAHDSQVPPMVFSDYRWLCSLLFLPGKTCMKTSRLDHFSTSIMNNDLPPL